MGSPEIGFTIACMGFLGFFVLLFGTLALMRWFRHKERLAMIEQGLMPADAVKIRNGKGTLAWGIGITAFGLALMCGLLLLGWRVGSARPLTSIGPILLPGLVVLFMGVALIIIYFATRPATDHEPVEETLPPAEMTPDLPALELEEVEESPEEQVARP